LLFFAVDCRPHDWCARASGASALLLIMVSRERLLRLGAAFAEHATTRRVRVVAQLLILVAIVFAVLRVRSLWHESHIELANVDWPAITGSFLLAVTGVLGTGFIWLVILRRLGANVLSRWTPIFFQAQLAKYIPGTLWQYAGRITLARARGLPTRVVARSLPIELGASIAGAGVACLSLLGVFGIPAALAVGAACISVATTNRSAKAGLRSSISAAAVAIPLYTLVWAAMGASFWLTAKALVTAPVAQLPFYTGAFAVAWVVGVVAVYAPGGIGVREGVLVALLHSRLGSADALVVAAASRVLLTVGDLTIGGAAFLILRRTEWVSAEPETPPHVSLDPPESVGH
jgi:glycosyltransferase 2 family protein